jgi:hypothetical protein
MLETLLQLLLAITSFRCYNTTFYWQILPVNAMLEKLKVVQFGVLQQKLMFHQFVRLLNILRKQLFQRVGQQ